MHRFFLFLFLLLASKASYSQSLSQDSLLNTSIESAINRYTSDTPKLLFIRNGEVVIDSSFFRKVAYSLNKKEVNITLHDYTHKTVPATECWGTQTDFGQWQRFYNGEKYIVWHAHVPYIYRDYAASDRKINYFYSKNLVSEILPLNKKNVYEIADSNDIKQLKAYLKTHDIEKSKDGGSALSPDVDVLSEIENNYILGDFIAFHVQIAWAILQILSKCE